MKVRMCLVVGFAFLVSGCGDNAPTPDKAAEGEAAGQAHSVASVGKPTANDCSGQLLSWVSESFAIQAGNASDTEAGCEIALDAAGANYETIQNAVTAGFAAKGYQLVEKQEAQRGQRLTYRGATRDVSVLMRSKRVVPMAMPGGVAHLDIHWYDPEIARSLKKSE